MKRSSLTLIVAAAAALALVAATPSGAAGPSKLWYQLRVVYLGTHTWETINRDGGKMGGTFKSAFTGKTDTSVLVRFERNGFRVRGSDFTGRVTRYDSDWYYDWYMGTHAPCRERKSARLVGSKTFVGTFGAEPAYRRGWTFLGLTAGALTREQVDEPAVAPCAGPGFRDRRGTLINADGVKNGEKPLYLVPEKKYEGAGGAVIAMTRIPSDRFKGPEAYTVGKFGQQSFTLFSHLVVRQPPTYDAKSGTITKWDVDEAWSFAFTRCPGTAPC